MNKKSFFLMCVIGICAIGVLMYSFLSNNVTAMIPSASSYASTFKDWSVHFSDEMNPDTFTNETVTVFDNNNDKVSVTIEWNDDYTILTLLSPEDGYNMDENYLITISDNIETAQGDHLTKSLTHAFQAVKELPNIKNNEQLVTLLNERIEKTIQGNEGFSFQDETTESSDSAADTATSSGAGNDAPTSETNVQVEGIDEGDIVKSDGDYLYFARENDIVIASTNGTSSNVISRIQEKEFHAQELLLHNDLLISIGYTYESIRSDIKNELSEQSPNEDIAYPPVYSTQTSVFIYDISNKEDPKQIREFTIEGDLTASRKMNGFLYVVGNNHPPYHLMRNEGENIDEQAIEFRPFVKDTAVSDEGKPINYEDLYFFPESDEESFMLLSTIDLNDMEQEANVETYLGASNQIYMSENHLYTAVNKYHPSESTSKKTTTDIMMPQSADTEIIQFNIDGGKMTYNASTIVNGTLINQFAMDERNGTFRVATTKGDMWQDNQPSTNNLYTFDTDLNSLGEIEGLAKGEQIYSVRFMENVAYMVTFKQVDPLFVINLEDAENPEVLGELKIPGFSNYLHPLDDNHVIGFGQHTKLEDVKGSSEPRVRQVGLKISVFDVSDPRNPKEKFSEILGQGGSYSEINYNHKSLYKHPEKNLFGFPAQIYETKTVHKGDAIYEEQTYVYEGAFLYEISPDAGIELKDTITHQDQAQDIEYPEWESQIMRMVSVGDLLYTLSFDQMNVYDINDERITQTIKLP
ncbi:beta-propeller domain-containing protein [Aquibacillus rhizosphaerae]|uniref:Beta-propeller domain-containing protein n=1 Tax=Aquibacillus rhizosphaerae TaxID=3051431 RepID=A0ABT7LF49_9BACI|nr:beta-propeller domain-containing protein [Aquibacillus sp. LR5S19]MDL4843186.1 beta-propeller domain-containing protein [Aquibacillus sp. LR5S19]